VGIELVIGQRKKKRVPSKSADTTKLGGHQFRLRYRSSLDRKMTEISPSLATIDITSQPIVTTTFGQGTLITFIVQLESFDCTLNLIWFVFRSRSIMSLDWKLDAAPPVQPSGPSPTTPKSKFSSLSLEAGGGSLSGGASLALLKHADCVPQEGGTICSFLKGKDGRTVCLARKCTKLSHKNDGREG
jgi:hypothetical protein